MLRASVQPVSADCSSNGHSTGCLQLVVPQKLFLLHSQSSQHPSNAISLAGSRPDFDDVTHTIHLQASSLTAMLSHALRLWFSQSPILTISLPFGVSSC